MVSNFLQAKVMTTLWNMFQIVSMRGQSTVHCCIQMKIAIPQGHASSASYSFKTALNSSLYCIPGWMISDDVTLLQRITQIFPLKAAPGTPSIFHGTENSWVKTQLPLADTRYFLRWLYVLHIWISAWCLLALCCWGQNFELGFRNLILASAATMSLTLNKGYATSCIQLKKKVIYL